MINNAIASLVEYAVQNGLISEDDRIYSVNALLERGLIEVCGKLEAPGRPNLYRTTERFLRAAGISDVEQLPPLPEQEPQETAQTPDAVQAEPEAALPEDGGASQ